MENFRLRKRPRKVPIEETLLWKSGRSTLHFVGRKQKQQKRIGRKKKIERRFQKVELKDKEIEEQIRKLKRKKAVTKMDKIVSESQR